MRTPLLIAVLYAATVLSLAVGSFTNASAAETNPAAPAEVPSLIGKRLADMFAAGFGHGPNSLKEAGRLYNAARSDAKGDPRVEYAYGLVLLKQLRQNEAIAQFQSVTKSLPEYWPAWQGMIWCQFVARDYASRYQRLTEFARRLTDSKSDLSERRQSVEWKKPRCWSASERPSCNRISAPLDKSFRRTPVGQMAESPVKRG